MYGLRGYSLLLLHLSVLLLLSIVIAQESPSGYYTSVLKSDGFWRVNGNWDKPGFPITRNTSAILPTTTSDASVILENGTSNIVFQTVIGSKRRVRVGPKAHLTIIPYVNRGGSCLANIDICTSTIGNPLTVTVTDVLNPNNQTVVYLKNLQSGQTFSLLLTSRGNGTFVGSISTDVSNSSRCQFPNTTTLCVDFGDMVNVSYPSYCIPQQIVTVSLYLDCGRYDNVSSDEIVQILLEKSIQNNIQLLEDLQHKAQFLLANLPEFNDIFQYFDFTQLAELILQASATCLGDYCSEVDDFLAALKQYAP